MIAVALPRGDTEVSPLFSLEGRLLGVPQQLQPVDHPRRYHLRRVPGTVLLTVRPVAALKCSTDTTSSSPIMPRLVIVENYFKICNDLRISTRYKRIAVTTRQLPLTPTTALRLAALCGKMPAAFVRENPPGQPT